MNRGSREIAEAVAALRRGEVIGLPTETVYGLAGDASNATAVRRIFELKGRPLEHPLIVHLADAATLGAWALDIPRAARALAERFWPGPMTLILKRARRVSDLVTGGQDTVGIRVPSHPVARAVLTQFGGGLAAPSANRFGRISPTRRAHVLSEFGNSVPIVLDGGDCAIGIESTIVDLSGEHARILRPGALGAHELERVIGRVAHGRHGHHGAPRAPGTLAAHYAPRTPVQLVAHAALVARQHAAKKRGERIATMSVGKLPPGAEGIAMPRSPGPYARFLYASLRDLDAQGYERILIERPPNTFVWTAVRDRLERAAAGSGVDPEDGT